MKEVSNLREWLPVLLFALGCSLAASSCSPDVMGDGNRAVAGLIGIIGPLTVIGAFVLKGAQTARVVGRLRTAILFEDLVIAGLWAVFGGCGG